MDTFAGSIVQAFINLFLKWVIQFNQSNTLDTIRKIVSPYPLHMGVLLSLRARELPGGGGLQDPENCLLPLQPVPFHSNTLVRFKPVYKLARDWTLTVVWGLNVTLVCMPDTWCGPASRKDPNNPKHLGTCHAGVLQQHPKALVKPCHHGGLLYPGELCACCLNLYW